MTFSTKALIVLGTTVAGTVIAYNIASKRQAKEARERRLARQARREAEMRETGS